MIRIITFDLDDTLWAVNPIMQRANQTLYRWLAEHAPGFTARYRLQDFASLRREVVEAHPEHAHSVTAIRLGVLRRGLAASGYRGAELERLVAEAFECFLEARNQVSFYQHATQMLDQLHGRYRLGALSNGNADIARVGLGHRFDFCFNADQVGRAKPHPLMFEKMLAYTGATPEEVVHVGDHPVHDVQGAQAAGVYSLWVNLEGGRWPPEIQPPDLQVTCLSEIPATLEEFEGRLHNASSVDK